MLLNDTSAAGKSIIEVSSGSTVTSLGITARVLYDNDDTTAFVSNKASLDRMRELQFFGLRVALYGGPTYTDTTDPRGPVEWARRLGRENANMVNLGQYDNEHNWKSHVRWTGPQILKQLPEINVFCMGMGSTGCVAGTGIYLKSQKPSVKVVGVCNVEADLIPGPRERPMHKTSPFPWREAVDFTESVGSTESYRLSLKLSRQGIIAGPSSGMALQGLFDFLQREKDNGTLDRYADQSTGELSCVFICCDLPQKHLDTYFKKLPPDEFKPIVNDVSSLPPLFSSPIPLPVSPRGLPLLIKLDDVGATGGRPARLQLPMGDRPGEISSSSHTHDSRPDQTARVKHSVRRSSSSGSRGRCLSPFRPLHRPTLPPRL